MKLNFAEKILSNKKKSNHFGIISLAIIILFFLNNIMEIRFIQDDAFTSFRYVKNFTDGNGLVFNSGEKVEGYTNFLWVIILSGERFLDKTFFHDHSQVTTEEQKQEREREQIEKTAQVLSIFFAVLVLILTYSLARIKIKFETESNSLIENLVQVITSLVPVFLLAFSTPLLYWGGSGMETSFFVFLTLFSIILYLNNFERGRPDYWFVLISVLNSLLRPEGFIVFILIIMHRLLYNYFSSSKKNIFLKVRLLIDRNLQKEIIFYSIPLAVFICFRIIYYGYPLPNTFYAKTEFSIEFINRGLNYFLDFAVSYLLYGFVLLLPLILLRNRKKLLETSLFFWLILSWTIINIIIGGDVLPIHRFFLPIMPLIFILFVRAIPDAINFLISKREKLAAAISLTVILIIASSGFINYTIQKSNMMDKRAYEAGLVKKMKIYAGWVNNQNTSKIKIMSKNKIMVAMSTIGAFSFYTDAYVIDLVGLTDGYISHHPKEVEEINDELPVLWKERHYNVEYVLAQKPDYIIFPAGSKPSAFAECALFVQNDFYRNYYTQIFYSDELHQMLPIFTRRKDAVYDSSKTICSNKYLKHYIHANNLFLKMLGNKEKNILPSIIAECDSVFNFCPQKLNDINTLKGMVFFHSKNYIIAENYLLKAVRNNKSNSIAFYYLMKIYQLCGRIDEALRLIPKITLYSPGTFPNLVVQ